jgi:hypothetical protein
LAKASRFVVEAASRAAQPTPFPKPTARRKSASRPPERYGLSGAIDLRQPNRILSNDEHRQPNLDRQIANTMSILRGARVLLDNGLHHRAKNLRAISASKPRVASTVRVRH